MITRRDLLILACGAAAGGAGRAHATPAAMEEAIRKVTGGAAAPKGRVRLDVPPLIENGNSVVLSVAVDSPMTAADHVKAIHVFAPQNPLPNMVSVYLGPRAGRARFTTRVRVADSQTLVALAQLSDGSFWSDSVAVVVTLAACAEEVK
ncbi:MAG TPA: SoxY-related AACIE arm protein [Burkholderiales bacterium]|nr:SoxY-related AACIE arm protein [Burkholderiales bacterium]